MSKITRALQKIFGGSLTASGNIAVFGSTALGAPAYSLDPVVIQSLAPYLQGWNAATVGTKSPVLQDMNAMFYLLSRQVAYLLQEGTPEWDVATVYYSNGFAKQNGVLYVSNVDNNVGNDPATDSNNWTPYLLKTQSPVTAKAWAVFDGINTIGGDAYLLNSFNVSSVTKVGTGRYRLNFTTPLPTADYSVAGFAGPQDGNTFGTADAANICGGYGGLAGSATRSTTQCDVFAVINNAPVQPGSVSVTIFG